MSLSRAECHPERKESGDVGEYTGSYLCPEMAGKQEEEGTGFDEFTLMTGQMGGGGERGVSLGSPVHIYECVAPG